MLCLNTSLDLKPLPHYMLYGFHVYVLCTVITYETAREANQGTVMCFCTISCQLFTNKQAGKFLYFINNIDMAARAFIMYQTLK